MPEENHSNTPTSLNTWKALKKPLFFLGFSLLFSILCLLGTYEYKQQMAEKESAGESALRGLESEYSHKIQAENFYKTMNYKNFKEFVKKGFFDEESQKSDDWDLLKLEFRLKKQIEDLVKKMHIPSANIEELKSEVFEIPSIPVMPEFSVYKTQLTLRLGVLHEGDVLNILENLTFNPPIGLMNNQHCQLNRLVAEVDVKQASLANFEALCTVSLYKARIEKNNEK
jgi:hypothetical protein